MFKNVTFLIEEYHCVFLLEELEVASICSTMQLNLSSVSAKSIDNQEEFKAVSLNQIQRNDSYA